MEEAEAQDHVEADEERKGQPPDRKPEQFRRIASGRGDGCRGQPSQRQRDEWRQEDNGHTEPIIVAMAVCSHLFDPIAHAIEEPVGLCVGEKLL